MSVLAIARAFYRALLGLSNTAARESRNVWRELEPRDLTGSWRSTRAEDRLFRVVAQSQLSAARLASAYVDRIVAEQVATPSPQAAVFDRALAGVASDGRDLDTLLRQPLIAAVARISGGMAPDVAMKAGESQMVTIASTQTSDAGRHATDIAMTADPKVTGWVRILNPPSCSRCAILAGRVYRWSDGFERHPRCDCVHAPAVEDVADDLRTDPAAYFDSLSTADQDRYFTKAGADAIREGANIGQVVNARRSAAGLSRPGRLTADERRALLGDGRGRLQKIDVYGRDLAVTSEGTTKRGLAGQLLMPIEGTERRPGERYDRSRAPRLMPEAIAELANGDREENIRLLRLYGYLI